MNEQTANQHPPYQLFCGVDIAARSFTASMIKEQAGVKNQPDKASSYVQNEAAYLEFQQALLEKEPNPTLVLLVMEATGNYWISLATFLHRAGFAVAVINPSQAHDFAKVLLRRSKMTSSMPRTWPS